MRQPAYALALVLSVTATASACDADEASDPAAFVHQDFYARLQGHTAGFTVVDGDWKEDWGDAAAYGPAFFARAGLTEGRADLLATARAAYERDREVVQTADILGGDVNEILMSVLGMVEHIAATGELADLPVVDQLLRGVQLLLEAADYYMTPEMQPGYAMETYGPTVVNMVFGLIALQRALLQRDSFASELIAFCRAQWDVMSASAWNGTSYDFGAGREGLFLYPNVTMIIVAVRLYQLTGDEAFRDRALATHAGMQPLRVDPASGLAGPGRYRSPYSATYMGATTSDYTTLSSQNYLLFALYSLYEVTGDKSYLVEARQVLDFLEGYLEGRWCLAHLHKAPCDPACDTGGVCVAGTCSDDRCGDAVLHHWLDGRLALPTDHEFFCSGCNLQLLYMMWYWQHGLAPPQLPNE